MMDQIVYLALGTNLGNRAKNLGAALRALPPGVRVMVHSAVYETPPWGISDQPPFYNQALRGVTSLSPAALLSFIKGIETKMGRTATVRYGPRVIDIDILLYGDRIVDEPGLTIPHARMHERGFVLAPLREIAPDLLHPALGLTIAALYQKVDTTGIQQVEFTPADARISEPPETAA